MKRVALVFPLMLLAVAAVAGPLTPHPVYAAEPFPVSDVAHRLSYSLATGYLGFSFGDGALANWRGVDFTPAITYNPHQSAAVFLALDQGFGVRPGDGNLTAVKLAANLFAYPPTSIESKLGLTVGAGVMWIGKARVSEWQGFEGHITVDAPINDWLGAYASYGHGVSFSSDRADLDYVKAGLQGGFQPARR